MINLQSNILFRILTFLSLFVFSSSFAGWNTAAIDHHGLHEDGESFFNWNLKCHWYLNFYPIVTRISTCFWQGLKIVLSSRNVKMKMHIDERCPFFANLCTLLEIEVKAAWICVNWHWLKGFSRWIVVVKVVVVFILRLEASLSLNIIAEWS